MLTLHPTARKVSTGFIPMVTVRNATGHMVGSKCPQGEAREFRTFTTRMAAELDAWVIAQNVVNRIPQVVKLADA